MTRSTVNSRMLQCNWFDDFVSDLLYLLFSVEIFLIFAVSYCVHTQVHFLIFMQYYPAGKHLHKRDSHVISVLS